MSELKAKKHILLEQKKEEANEKTKIKVLPPSEFPETVREVTEEHNDDTYRENL
jgi:hypothetical protein